MLARLQPLILIRLWAALLLITIGLQVAAPVVAPLEQTHGSAFAAATYDVAVAVQRGDSGARQVVAPQPLVPAATPEERPATGPAVHTALPAPRPAATGPPPPDIHAWQPAPRAPPRA